MEATQVRIVPVPAANCVILREGECQTYAM